MADDEDLPPDGDGDGEGEDDDDGYEDDGYEDDDEPYYESTFVAIVEVMGKVITNTDLHKHVENLIRLWGNEKSRLIVEQSKADGTRAQAERDAEVARATSARELEEARSKTERDLEEHRAKLRLALDKEWGTRQVKVTGWRYLLSAGVVVVVCYCAHEKLLAEQQLGLLLAGIVGSLFVQPRNEKRD